MKLDPMPEQDADSGRFVTSFPLEDFEGALREIGPASTNEVASEVGCAYRTAHARLSDLESEGRVSSRSVGRAKLWRVEEGGEAV